MAKKMGFLVSLFFLGVGLHEVARAGVFEMVVASRDSQRDLPSQKAGVTPESEAVQGSQSTDESQTSDGSEDSRSSKKKSKRRKPREKEAEGTKAPNRFDADTFIKSRYELNGQSLEVDTE